MQDGTDEAKWRELARQLSCPEGPAGMETADMMRTTNDMMIRSAMEVLGITGNDQVLEIGPGGGRHVEYLFEQVAPARYTGVDISETMVREAGRYHAEKPYAGRVSFLLSDGIQLPFGDASFDRAFSVNTVYFWQDSAAYAHELYRVMKPGGLISLAYGEKRFMETLPFTRYGFRLYDTEMVTRLLENSGFHLSGHSHKKEEFENTAGMKVQREYTVTLAKK